MSFLRRMLALLTACGACVTHAQPAPLPFNHVVVVGDSISRYDQDPASFCYPDYLTVPAVVDNYAAPGRKLAGPISYTFADVLAQSPNADAVIIQGGVNDLIEWDGESPGYGVVRANLRNAVTSMVQKARAREVQHILFVSILPWAGHGAWTAGKQQLTEEHNAWLQSYADTVNAVFVDAYELVRATSGWRKRMAPEYGGGLHPNEAGAQAIAALVNEEMLAYRVRYRPAGVDAAPWSDPNQIRLDSDQYIVAAIAGSNSQTGDAHDLDVTKVDPGSLALGADAASVVSADAQLADFDADGNMDVAYLFATADTGIVCGDTAVLLTGDLYDGTVFAGASDIETIDCESSDCHP